MVRLQNGVAELIDALVGKNRRAEFIRDAVREKLERSGVQLGKISEGDPKNRSR